VGPSSGRRNNLGQDRNRRAEFDFRYSTKDETDKDRADKALKGIAGKRLTYRRIAFAA
jgi:hypothetical protein